MCGLSFVGWPEGKAYAIPDKQAEDRLSRPELTDVVTTRWPAWTVSLTEVQCAGQTPQRTAGHASGDIRRACVPLGRAWDRPGLPDPSSLK